jgi:hypothetical protein
VALNKRGLAHEDKGDMDCAIADLLHRLETTAAERNVIDDT